jgi:hypothetical protein
VQSNSSSTLGQWRRNEEGRISIVVADIDIIDCRCADAAIAQNSRKLAACFITKRRDAPALPSKL